MHVRAADFHSNPTKIFDLSSYVSIEAKCKHSLGLGFQTTVLNGVKLYCG